MVNTLPSNIGDFKKLSHIDPNTITVKRMYGLRPYSVKCNKCNEELESVPWLPRDEDLLSDGFAKYLPHTHL